MSNVQSRRGRKVAEARRSRLVPFYWGVGALVILGAAFLLTWVIRNQNTELPTAPNAPVGRTEEGFWYKGNPDATVKVIEYADYQCPSCAFYNRSLSPIIQRDYIETGRVQFIFHELPLDVHQHAVPAAEAARCAGDQGKFWEMHDMLLVNQNQWATLRTVNNVFSGYAGQLGLDRGAFDQCLSAGTNRAAIVAASETAVAANVNATPTFDVNGQRVDMNGLPAAIESALRATGQ